MLNVDEQNMVYFPKYKKLIAEKKIRVSKKLQLQLNIIDKYCIDDDKFFDPELPNKYINFIENYLPLSDGSGKQFKLTLFQKVIIEQTFGWQIKFKKMIADEEEGFKEVETVERLFNELFIIMGRKNGKTELLAAITIAWMKIEGRKNNDAYIAALTTEQAKIMFDAMADMINDSKKLNKEGRSNNPYRVFKNKPSKIEYLPKNNAVTIIVNDEQKLHGKKISFITYDEIHTYDRDSSDVAKNGMLTAKGPLFAEITTNGTVRDGYFDKRYNQLAQNLDYILSNNEDANERQLSFFYELDDFADVEDPANYVKSVPNLGVTYGIEKLIADVRKAKSDPAKFVQLYATIFNFRQNATFSFFTDQDLNFFDYEEEEIFNNCPVIIGADFSQTQDYTAVAIVRIINEQYYCKLFGFVPENRLAEVNPAERRRLEELIEKGEMIAIDGDFNDQKIIFQIINEYISDNNLLPQIFGYDTYYSANFLSAWQQNYGTESDEKIIQGLLTFSEPTKMMQSMVKQGFVGTNSSYLIQNFRNVSVKTDNNGNVMPDKRASNFRIDAFMALMNAFIVYQKNKDRLEWVFE